jgi:hypothetical protein
MSPRKTPQLAPWLPPDKGGLLPQPPAVDIATLPTRPTLPPPILPPAEYLPAREPSAPRPPRPPAPVLAHTNDIATLRTERWGDAPQRRVVFTQYAEQHECEAERLRQRLAELTDLLPQRADALALKQSRLEVLQRERERAPLGGIEIQELAGLEQRLPEALATLQAERAEQVRLPEQIAYHRHVARRWRKRATLER